MHFYHRFYTCKYSQHRETWNIKQNNFNTHCTHIQFQRNSYSVISRFSPSEKASQPRKCEGINEMITAENTNMYSFIHVMKRYFVRFILFCCFHFHFHSQFPLFLYYQCSIKCVQIEIECKLDWWDLMSTRFVLLICLYFFSIPLRNICWNNIIQFQTAAYFVSITFLVCLLFVMELVAPSLIQPINKEKNNCMKCHS